MVSIWAFSGRHTGKSLRNTLMVQADNVSELLKQLFLFVALTSSQNKTSF